MRRRDFTKALLAASSTLAFPTVIRPAAAEVTGIRFGKQYGLPYLSLMVMEQEKLVEKHAARAGIRSLTIEWATMVTSRNCSASMTPITASPACASVGIGSRSLSPQPGASTVTHRKSFCKRSNTSRHTKLQLPTWTNSNVGPCPASVTAMRP